MSLLLSGKRSAIPDSGVARWEFEDDSDTTTAVDSWFDNDGSISGSTYTTTSAQGSLALSNDGTDDSVTVADSTLPAFDSDSFSIRSYVRLPSDNSASIIDKRSGSSFEGWNLEYNNSSVRMVVDDGSATAAESSASLNTGTFYELVGVVDRGNDQLRVYIDGSQDGSADISGLGNIETTVDLGLAARVNDSSFFLNAILDDPRIYDKALTDTEVSNLNSTGSIGG